MYFILFFDGIINVFTSLKFLLFVPLIAVLVQVCLRILFSDSNDKYAILHILRSLGRASILSTFITIIFVLVTPLFLDKNELMDFSFIIDNIWVIVKTGIIAELCVHLLAFFEILDIKINNYHPKSLGIEMNSIFVRGIVAFYFLFDLILIKLFPEVDFNIVKRPGFVFFIITYLLSLIPLILFSRLFKNSRDVGFTNQVTAILSSFIIFSTYCSSILHSIKNLN